MASSMRRRPSHGGGGAPERVAENWERLVRAALKRDRACGVGPGSSAAPHGAGAGVGLASAVPPSLGRTTNTEHILQAADDIEDDDPNVARILCEQAYTMAQNLDPSSDGRGVLQFKTGLASVIKQKLAKKDGASINRQNDIEDVGSEYTSDGSVDSNGQPALKRSTGNWRACYMILGVEFCECVAFFAIGTNLVTYLTTVLHESKVTAAERLCLGRRVLRHATYRSLLG